MMHRRMVRKRKEIPWWLKRIDLVRDELRSIRFPSTAEEGLRHCADLSAACMGVFKDEIRKALHTKGEEPVERETSRLSAHFSRMDERWKAGRKEGRVSSKRH